MERRAGDMEARTPGDLIFNKRRELGLTQEDLEWESGVSARQIGNIENNKHKPAFETIERLEMALGIPLMEVFVSYWRQKRTDGEKGNSTREAVKRLEKELIRRKLSDKEIQMVIEKALADISSKEL